MTREQALHSAAQLHAELFQPFTMKPIGGEGSPARLEQEAQIAAHKQLLEALSAYAGKAFDDEADRLVGASHE
jgi:hypothetical protein